MLHVAHVSKQNEEGEVFMIIVTAEEQTTKLNVFSSIRLGNKRSLVEVNSAG